MTFRSFRRRSSPSVRYVERLERRIVMADAVAGVGAGLVANYFSDPELRNLAATRVDQTVNFDWGQSAPIAGVGQDQFSVRWVGKVQAQFSETYTFHTLSDEGVALWVDGQQIIDNFNDHTLTEDAGTITLKAGETYDIRLDYYDNAFDATMKLSWSSASTAKQIIPATQLYADAGYTSGAFLNTGVGGAVGAVSSAGQTYQVVGGGHGTSGSSDKFQFLYQSLNGDGELIARVDAAQGSSGGAEAGVMIRDSLAANATFAAVVVNANGVAAFETRSANSANVTSSAETTSGNSGLYWIKLVRDGNFFRGYASATGAADAWKYFGSLNIPMDRSAFAGLTATSGTLGGTNTARFDNVILRAVAPIGAGLDQVRDWSKGQIFVDMAKQARTPAKPNFNGPVVMDSTGWPVEDFMTILATGYKNQAHLLNGTYKVSFTGQATLGTWSTPGGKILNQSYNAATNTTTADFVIAAQQSQDNWYAGLQFFNSRREPGGPLNSGITNLKVIRPGYAANTTQTFQDSYLAHLKQYSVLRFMDFAATNDNPVADWSQRTTPGSARQSSTSGVAWEHAIELANRLDKDVWINIPAQANDNYVRELATLLRNTLEPDRAVYVEYSNEVWNGIFSQNSENLAMAQAEVAAGNSPLNADGETNAIYWGWRRVANRTKQISDIFGEVFGRSAINGRVRPVLAGQHANPEVVRQGIEFIERTYGAPRQFLYGVAVAPYIAMGSIDDTNPNMTVQEIINRLQASANSNANRYHTHDTYARRYGLANLTYEGGPDVAGANNLEAKRAAMLDPQMKDVSLSYLKGWYRAGGGLFTWFLGGPTNYSQHGMWGVTDNPEQLDSPKASAMIEIASSQRTPLIWGAAAPSTFDARAVAGATQPYSTPYRVDPGQGNSFDYFVRAPRGGNYRIVLSAGTAGSNEQIRVVVNDTDVRTITLNNTGSSTSFVNNVVGTFHLEAGMNLIRLTSIRETTWNIATVTVEPGASSSGSAPTVAQSASASPTSINGKTTNLSVLGADDGGESKLVYSWEAIDQQAMAVTFSANGTNAAKNTTATFTKAGTYQLRVTISDGVRTATSTVNVTVNQVLTSITVAPTGRTLANGESQQLIATARDQFGVSLTSQPGFTWSVDNAFGTVSSTGLYTAPSSGLGTATVRAAVGAISGTATVTTASPRPADNVAYPLPGIEYAYYHGVWSNVPNFDTLTPVKTGLLNNISIAPRQQNDNFAFQYTGYLNVPASGTYTFYLTSDDGSKLSIGGKQVVDNDGKHSLRERTGSIILDAGWHSFKLGYFDAGGGEAVSLDYSGPALASRQPIPDSALQRADRAPTVATPPSASPNPVSGNQAQLSVVGADESGENILTYTWSTLSSPSGASAPSYTVNGTNAARNTIATFSKAGDYLLQVAISDGLMTTNATLNVTVAATVTGISVSPAQVTLKQGESRQFTAAAKDQFGNTISNPPPFSWSTQANGGTITADGLYTAPANTVGNFAVTASINGVSGSANVSVTETTAPTVATPATANPNPVPAGQTTTSLSVLGADNGGESSLTYTWQATSIPQGAPTPSFSANGTNSAKNTIAGGLQSGSYTFHTTISDGSGSVTSSVQVEVGVSNPSSPVLLANATATPSTVTAKQTQLSTLARDDGPDSALIYTWSTTGTPPAPVSYSANGSNAARNTTATFTKAGTYNFIVNISNGQSSITSSTSVTVQQTLTSIAVAPSSAAVTQGSTRQFTATAQDQFGNAMASQPSFSWNVSSTGTAGSISNTGLYTAPTSGTPVDTVTASASGKQTSATVSVVPAGQLDLFGQSMDIGSPAIAGGYSRSSNAYHVSGSGADIWGTLDQFHYVYKAFSGDGQIVARVDSVPNTHSRAKAGLMFRETLAADSQHVNLIISPDQTTSLQYRRAAGTGSSMLGSAGGAATPYWLKLVRQGTTFNGYRSADGVEWTLVGTREMAVGSTIYVGLSVTSHDPAVVNTSVFSNVSVANIGTLSAVPISSAPATPSTSAAAIVDGGPTTYFRGAKPNGAWVGLDLGAPRTITQIIFAPRRGNAASMHGGTFEATNNADFSGEVSTLHVLNFQGGSKVESAVVNVSASQAFRYIRYAGPRGSFGELAELSVVGS